MLLFIINVVSQQVCSYPETEKVSVTTKLKIDR